MIKQNLLEKYNMKKESNIKIIIFICLFVLIFSFLIFSQADVANAQIKFKPQINIGKFIKSGDGYTIPGSTKGIAEYIHAIYNYAIAVVGIFAVVIMMFGGITWIAAAGNAERISEAKAWIGASLTGLLLTLCSWMILKTVNPALVDFNTTEIKPIQAIKETNEVYGCCSGLFNYDTNANDSCSDNVTETRCKAQNGTFNANTYCYKLTTACADQNGKTKGACITNTKATANITGPTQEEYCTCTSDVLQENCIDPTQTKKYFVENYFCKSNKVTCEYFK